MCWLSIPCLTLIGCAHANKWEMRWETRFDDFVDLRTRTQQKHNNVQALYQAVSLQQTQPSTGTECKYSDWVRYQKLKPRLMKYTVLGIWIPTVVMASSWKYYYRIAAEDKDVALDTRRRRLFTCQGVSISVLWDNPTVLLLWLLRELCLNSEEYWSNFTFQTRSVKRTPPMTW